MNILGLDIGGANLKAAHTSGASGVLRFALWKNPAGLADALRALTHPLPAADAWAVTMTGELCDCFETRRQGVQALLAAAEAVAGVTPLRVWRNDGRFVDAGAARNDPLAVASANWLALGTFAGRFAPRGLTVLIDIGSTTTDLVPLVDGVPVPRGRTDPERLQSQELLYMGVRRTPACALLGTRAAAELFATTHDAYLTLGAVPEDQNDCDTADGRPATKAAARSRLARMLCADRETTTQDEIRKLAEHIRFRQVTMLGFALDYVVKDRPEPLQHVLVSGSGEFLADLAIRDKFGPKIPVLPLSKRVGHELSTAACAQAVAVLAAEGRHG